MASSKAALSQTSDATGRELAPDFAARLQRLSTVDLLEVCCRLREEVRRMLQERASIRKDSSETRSG
jgi:hypothetical protein